jgi:hypothetical protein
MASSDSPDLIASNLFIIRLRPFSFVQTPDGRSHLLHPLPLFAAVHRGIVSLIENGLSLDSKKLFLN